MRRRGVLLAGALLVAGCGGSGGNAAAVDSTEVVCDEFAGFVRDGGDRAKVVASIGEVIGNADQVLQDNYGTLTNTVDGTESAQQLADDVFAQSCFDAGWDG